MRIQIHEENCEPPVQVLRTRKIIMTQEEYGKLKTLFCEGKGWSLDYPQTVNLRSITLTGNYKWMPESDVEFCIEIEGQEKVQQQKDQITILKLI